MNALISYHFIPQCSVAIAFQIHEAVGRVGGSIYPKYDTGTIELKMSTLNRVKEGRAFLSNVMEGEYDKESLYRSLRRMLSPASTGYGWTNALWAEDV